MKPPPLPSLLRGIFLCILWQFLSWWYNVGGYLRGGRSVEYFIYCDESEQKGHLFSKFYGGALVRSIHISEVIQTLEACKKKWFNW